MRSHHDGASSFLIRNHAAISSRRTSCCSGSAARRSLTATIPRSRLPSTHDDRPTRARAIGRGHLLLERSPAVRAIGREPGFPELGEQHCGVGNADRVDHEHVDARQRQPAAPPRRRTRATVARCPTRTRSTAPRARPSPRRACRSDRRHRSRSARRRARRSRARRRCSCSSRSLARAGARSRTGYRAPADPPARVAKWVADASLRYSPSCGARSSMSLQSGRFESRMRSGFASARSISAPRSDGVRMPVLEQHLAVARSGLGVTHRVDRQANITQTEVATEAPEQLDDLDVDVGIVDADHLGPELPVLAVAPGLRLLGPEVRCEVPDLPRRRRSVLHERAHDRRGPLGRAAPAGGRPDRRSRTSPCARRRWSRRPAANTS